MSPPKNRREEIGNVEETIEMQPLNDSNEDNHEDDVADGNDHRNERDEYQKTALGIWFMLFSWMSPEIDKCNEPNHLRNYESIKKCVYRERAEINHKLWNLNSGTNFSSKFLRFTLHRLFLATVFHIISIISGFLTLTVAFDHLLLYINETLNSGNQFEMDDLNQTDTELIINAVPTHDRSKADATAWFQYLVLFELIRAFSTSMTSIIVIRTSIRTNQALICALYVKYFQTPNPSKDLMKLNSDIKILYNMIKSFPFFIGYIVTFCLTLGYTISVLGEIFFYPKYFWTLAIIFLWFIALNSVTIIYDAYHNEKRRSLKREGFSILRDIIENFRTFKLLAIEDPVKKQISDLKDAELHKQKWLIFMCMNFITLTFTWPLFITVMSVIVLPMLFQKEIIIEDMFRILIINYWSIYLPRMFADSITLIRDGYNILHRWDTSMERQPKNDISSEEMERMKKENLCFEFKIKKSQSNDLETITIKKGCKICVESKYNSNENDLLRFLAGFNSEVKSALQKDLLCFGKVTFMPSKSWISTDTIEDNIVFGKAYDENKYKKILKICELEVLANNKNQEIIDRESVSTGEAHRISLARALYSDADIFIFEQFLSTVDGETSQKIVENIENDDELKEKTIIYSSDKFRDFCFKQNFEFIILDSNGFILYDKLEDPDYEEKAEIEACSFTEHEKLNKSLESNSKYNLKRDKFYSFVSDFPDYFLLGKGNSFEMKPFIVQNDRSTKGLVRTGEARSIDENDDEKKDQTKNQVDNQTEEGTSSSEIRSEMKSIGVIIVLHLMIAFLYQFANFKLNNIQPLYIYLLYFVVLICLHFILSIAFTIHSSKRLKVFYTLVLEYFFNCGLEFFENETNARLRTLFSDDFSYVESNILIKFNDILCRFFGAIASFMFINWIIAYPLIDWKNTFRDNSDVTIVISISLILIAFLYPFIAVLWMYKNFKKLKTCLKRIFKANRALYSNVEGYFNDSVEGHETIYINGYMDQRKNSILDEEKTRNRNKKINKNANKKPGFIERFYDRLDRYQGANWLLESITHWLNIRIDLFIIGYIVVLWIYGIWFVETLGETWTILLIIFAMIINYFLQFVIINLFRFYNDLGSFRRIIDYREAMKKNTEIDKKSQNSNENEKNLEGDIVFSNVSFSYSKKDDSKILKAINLEIKKGQKIRITGKSGAGKTSLINVFCRLFKYEGSINIGESNILELDLLRYRASISVIPQNLKLFLPTIYENIHPNSKFKNVVLKEYKEVDAALKETGYEDGKPTDLSKFDKNNVSDNNIKSILLAKAILDKRPILIMDEFSIQLPEGRNIFDILEKHFKNTTIIYITHEDSSIENARKSFFNKSYEIVDGKISPIS